MSTCFELPLTPNYVRDWDFGMAIRELIQNGLDQQSVDAKSVFSVDYDPDTQKLKFFKRKVTSESKHRCFSAAVPNPLTRIRSASSGKATRLPPWF